MVFTHFGFWVVSTHYPPSLPPIHTHTMGFLDSSGSRDPDRCSSIPNLGIQALNQIAENVWGKRKIWDWVAAYLHQSSRGFARGRNPLDVWSSVRIEKISGVIPKTRCPVVGIWFWNQKHCDSAWESCWFTNISLLRYPDWICLLYTSDAADE